MIERLKYHFEPQKGWINDPNGLVFFRGRYHIFFQHVPYALVSGHMHWGHAVSDDLINWEHLPIALFPDRPYESSGGCYSGSAVVKDDRLFLFYTSVAHDLEQTQSIAYSDDGINFTKYSGNPVIVDAPVGNNENFRDPKVTLIGDTYYMVCGSSADYIGHVLLYKSTNLFDWEYVGVVFNQPGYGPVSECPDLFEFEGKYVLLLSKQGAIEYSSLAIYGDFDGKTFTPISIHCFEAGPDFYAPQTFEDDKGRRIMIGWLYNWEKKTPDGVDYVGALTIPREIKMNDGKLINFPVEEAWHLLTDSDEHVRVRGNEVEMFDGERVVMTLRPDEVRDVRILRDTKTIEVFINGGELSASFWYSK